MNKVSKKIWLAALIVLVLLSVAGILFALGSRSKTFRGDGLSTSMSHEQFMAESSKLTGLLDSGGLEAAFDRVQEQLTANPSFARDCHPLMHALGHAAHKKLGSFAAAQHSKGEVCNSGYVHGLVEAGFVETTDIDQAVRESCVDVSGSAFSEWQCAHGVGHGVMYATNRNVEESLKHCGSLTKAFPRNACVNGVFMELFIVVGHDGHADKNRREQALSANCTEWPKQYRGDCYFYLPTAILEINPNQYSQAADKCYESETDFVASCISGVGSQAMKDNVTKPGIAADFCESIKSPYRSSCASGAIGLFINHHASTSAAKPLCSNEFKSFLYVCETKIFERNQLYGI